MQGDMPLSEVIIIYFEWREEKEKDGQVKCTRIHREGYKFDDRQAGRQTGRQASLIGRLHTSMRHDGNLAISQASSVHRKRVKESISLFEMQEVQVQMRVNEDERGKTMTAHWWIVNHCVFTPLTSDSPFNEEWLITRECWGCFWRSFSFSLHLGHWRLSLSLLSPIN